MEDLTDLPLCESTRNNISLADRNAIIAAIRPAFARQRVQSEESAVAPYQYHFPDFDSVVHHEHPPVNKVQAGRIFMDAPLTMDEYLQNQAQRLEALEATIESHDGTHTLVDIQADGSGSGTAGFTYFPTQTFAEFKERDTGGETIPLSQFSTSTFAELQDRASGSGTAIFTHFPNDNISASSMVSTEGTAQQSSMGSHDNRILTHSMISLRPDGTKYIDVSKARMIDALDWQRPSVEITAFKGQITGWIDNATEGLRRSRSVPNLSTSVVLDRNGTPGVVTTLNGSSKVDTVLSIVE